MKKLLIAIAVLAVPTLVVAASIDTQLVNRLKGHILLQVQQHGEAWYINPTDGKRYYMKDGATAYQMLREFGLGITDADLTKIPVGTLAGQTMQPLPTSEPVTPTPIASPVEKIDGLAAIRVSGGIWDNWDADLDNDGPFIDIVYLDSQGNIISNDATKTLPIVADVKVYAASNALAAKNRLVFSGHYNNDQIIFGSIYPRLRIPREQLSVNSAVDYKFGAVEVTIQTPTQGAFSSREDFIVLYE